MTVSELNPQDYFEYYELYLSAVANNIDLIQAYREQGEEIVAFFKNIPNKSWHHSYAAGKWTLAEVVQHIIDTERIFIHRCFRIARGEQANISGFDQDVYVPPSRANEKSQEALINEYAITRAYSISILESLTEADFHKKGTASQRPLTAGAAAFIVLGHEIWHNNIIKERYLT